MHNFSNKVLSTCSLVKIYNTYSHITSSYILPSLFLQLSLAHTHMLYKILQNLSLFFLCFDSACCFKLTKNLVSQFYPLSLFLSFTLSLSPSISTRTSLTFLQTPFLFTSLSIFYLPLSLSLLLFLSFNFSLCL